jgi:hypothetical protein
MEEHVIVDSSFSAIINAPLERIDSPFGALIQCPSRDDKARNCRDT